MIRIGTIFSGVGGLDLAVEALFGGQVVFNCEVDPAAATVLAARFPDTPNLGDITQVDWDAVEPVDVLCGGFPCQDVSSAGRRAGLKDGTRSGLWSHFATAINRLQPSIVIIENVRGLLSAKAQRYQPGVVESDDPDVDGRRRSDEFVLRAAGAVLGGLSDAGYDAVWTTFAAAAVGAPHRRERVFICAWRDVAVQHPGHCPGSPECGVEHETPTGWPGQPGQRSAAHPSGSPVGQHPAAASGEETGPQESHGSGDPGGKRPSGDRRPAAQPAGDRRQRGSCGDPMLPSAVSDLMPTPKARDALNGDCPAERARKSPNLCAETAQISEALLASPTSSDRFGAGRPAGRTGGDDLRTQVSLLPTSAAAADGNGGGISWGKYEAAVRRWEQATRPAPAPTEPNKNGNPRLSAAFAEWMMGWPAGWVTDLISPLTGRSRPPGMISRNDALKCIGNGVCPQQAHAALTSLLGLAVPGTIEPGVSLPTPTVSDRNVGVPGGGHDEYTRAPRLASAVEHDLMPTPGANLGEHGRDSGQDPVARRAAGHAVSLADEMCFLPTPTTRPVQPV